MACASVSRLVRSRAETSSLAAVAGDSGDQAAAAAELAGINRGFEDQDLDIDGLEARQAGVDIDKDADDILQDAVSSMAACALIRTSVASRSRCCSLTIEGLPLLCLHEAGGRNFSES